MRARRPPPERHYFGQGLSSSCSGYTIGASPSAIVGTNPGFLAYDCGSNEMFATGSGVMVNPNLNCACDVATGIDDAPHAIASLRQNYPNPFNSMTTIAFTLAQSSMVRLQVFDVRGRVIRNLVSGVLGPGDHAREWDGRDNHGMRAASGVYFYRLVAGDYNEVRKMVMLK